MSKSHRPSGAFTLIELLAVMAIVALLAALLVPMALRSKQKGARVVCAQNLRQIVTALHEYAFERDGFLPAADDTMNASLTCYIWDSSRDWHLLGKLIESGILADPHVLYCPAQAATVLQYSGGWRGFVRKGIHYRTSGYYYRIFGQTKPGITSEMIREMQGWRFETMPGRMGLVSDVFGNYGARDGESWAHKTPPGVNVGFFDGHAEFLTVQEEDYRRALRYNSDYGGVNLDIRDPFVYDFWLALDSGDFTELRRKWPL